MKNGVMAGGRALAPVVATLALVFAWVVAWYWPTARQIAEIWWRSDTFAHGLLVLPVFAWLVWRKRDAIGGLRPVPVPWLALPVALAGFGWLLGQMTGVDGLAHVSLVTLFVLSLVGTLGWRLSRVLAFPLLFLFFALPIGEFIQPTLMHYTAEFTVFALRLTGVPVFQEGLYFIVPNGRWSVVEACSGLRYLVASLFVGALYAYLNYTSLRRRLAFMVVAFVVPIVANWVRAYLTVMIGYLFGTEFVQGFIHIVYGWVFFGVVVLLMFWIGSRWREDRERPARSSSAHGAAPVPSPFRWLGAVPLALVAAVFPPLLQQIEEPVPPFVVELGVPAAQEGWTSVEGDVLGYVPNYRGHRGELLHGYRRGDGSVVGLYVAYYSRQRDDSELVSWANRLTGRGERGWRQVSTVDDRLPVGPAVGALLLTGDATRLAVWHWYWTNRRIVTGDVAAKAILALDHLTGQPDDAAFVAVFTPVETRLDEGRPIVEDFLRAHGAGIERMLDEAQVAQGRLADG